MEDGIDTVEKEEFETVIPGRQLKAGVTCGKKRAKDRSSRGQRMESVEKKKNHPKKKGSKREQSVIGRGVPEKGETPAFESIDSTKERAQERAVKLDAPNRIVFRCPNCDIALRMLVTKRQKWDDRDSLLDVDEGWSGRESEGNASECDDL